MEYTQKDLDKFSLKHYTYINQIFGDTTVREIISEVFPHKSFEFHVEETDADFDEDSEHHVLFDKCKNKFICSVDDGHQNTKKDVNDTLCQSYSLITYFGKKISKGRRNRQRQMTNLYRWLMDHTEFRNKLEHEILNNKANKNHWVDYTNQKKTIYLKMDIDSIHNNILDVLKKWDEYGYMYFMDDGKCKLVPHSTHK